MSLSQTETFQTDKQNSSLYKVEVRIPIVKSAHVHVKYTNRFFMVPLEHEYGYLERRQESS